MKRFLVEGCLLVGLTGIFSACERDATSAPHLAIAASDASSPLAQPIQQSVDEHPFVHADPRQVTGGAGGTFATGGTGGTGITTGTGGVGGTTGGTGGTMTGGGAGTLPR